MLVLAKLCDDEGLFHAAGVAMARRSAGDPRRLLVTVFVIAAVTTAVLSLDATVVRSTPSTSSSPTSATGWARTSRSISSRSADQHGWNEATVGSVITIAGVVGLLSQTPAGILIDRVQNRRAIIVVAALAVTVSSLVLPFVSGFALIAISQSVASLAGAVFAPAIAAVTLGLMGPRLFAPRIGRNEAFNHAGNATAAGVAALLAWSLGPVVVFWLMGVLAVLSVVATSRIRGDEIDDQLARGLDPDDDGHVRRRVDHAGDQPPAADLRDHRVHRSTWPTPRC